MRKSYNEKRQDVQHKVIKNHSDTLKNRKYLTDKILKPAGNAARDKANPRLQFPLSRVHHLLKKGNYAQRVSAGALGK